jgi:hypothetical protein
MPVSGSKRIELNIRNILRVVSAYDIYKYYIGHDFTFGKAFRSPLREGDKVPSFVVNVAKKGDLFHLDYGDPFKRGGCVDFVKQLYNVDYDMALRMIDRDLRIGIVSGNVVLPDIPRVKAAAPPEKEPAFIQVVTRKFNGQELDYWGSYHISLRELEENEVYAVSRLYIDRQLIGYNETQLQFAYKFGDRWKIYRPGAPKKEKWLTNVPNEYMSGMHRITEGCGKAVVTKSKKDEMVLAKIIPHVCSVQSESIVSINDKNITLLRERCGEVYVNFDSDMVGVQSCQYYNQFGFKWVNCPWGYTKPNGETIKDFADLARYHGMDEVIKHFQLKGIYDTLWGET